MSQEPSCSLLLRGIDNGDYDCLRRAIAVLARQPRQAQPLRDAAGRGRCLGGVGVSGRPALPGLPWAAVLSAGIQHQGVRWLQRARAAGADCRLGRERRTLYAAQAALGRALATARASLATNPA